MAIRVVADDSYEAARPLVQEYVVKYQHAFERVRSTCSGHSFEDVLQALKAEFEVQGIDVWGEVAKDAARLISGQNGGPILPRRIAALIPLSAATHGEKDEARHSKRGFHSA